MATVNSHLKKHIHLPPDIYPQSFKYRLVKIQTNPQTPQSEIGWFFWSFRFPVRPVLQPSIFSNSAQAKWHKKYPSFQDHPQHEQRVHHYPRVLMATLNKKEYELEYEQSSLGGKMWTAGTDIWQFQKKEVPFLNQVAVLSSSVESKVFGPTNSLSPSS